MVTAMGSSTAAAVGFDWCGVDRIGLKNRVLLVQVSNGGAA